MDSLVRASVSDSFTSLNAHMFKKPQKVKSLKIFGVFNKFQIYLLIKKVFTLISFLSNYYVVESILN